MVNNDLIKIINEELSNFDFLGNIASNKEKETLDLLRNEDFQKQFICDSLINTNKIKIKNGEANVDGDWEDLDDASKLNIEYYTTIEYKYDLKKEPMVFVLDFIGNNIRINIETKEDLVDRSSDSYYNNIDWNNIDVLLHTVHGDNINFVAFKKAPIKIQKLFIKEYIKSVVTNKTNIDIQTSDKDNIKNTPYC